MTRRYKSDYKSNRGVSRFHVDGLDTLEQAREKSAQVEREKLEAREFELKTACIAIEGFDAFEDWWDNDKCVPNFGPRAERIALLEERLARLKTQPEFGSKAWYEALPEIEV